MSRETYTSAALFGALTAIPVAIAWFQFALGASFGTALLAAAILAPCSAAAGVLTYHLLESAKEATKPVPVIYALGAGVAVALLYPSAGVAAQLLGEQWIGIQPRDIVPTAIAGLASAHFTQSRVLRSRAA